MKVQTPTFSAIVAPLSAPLFMVHPSSHSPLASQFSQDTTTVIDHANDLMTKEKKDDPDGGTDVDSVTEKCTVASASSDDSFGADYALSTIRHSVVGKFKSSARGFAQHSGARISPLWERGTNAIAFKPRPRRERAPLTTKQLEARKRRSDKIARISRRLQRINQDPFVASRVVLALAALLLILRAGDGPMATCLSLCAVMILYQTTQLASTTTLQIWYYVGVVSLIVSASSWMLWSLPFRNDGNLHLSDSATSPHNDWMWRQVVPRLWGLLLTLWLYRDITASKGGNGDDDAIDTIEVKATILGGKFLDEANTSAFRRPKWKTSVVVVQHGPIVLGEISVKELLEDTKGASKFRTTSFSHFLESSKGSSLIFLLKQGDTTQGICRVPIPTIRNMKMSSWFPILDSNEKVGELLVQIQDRPLAVPFLFRASTILPIVACFVVAACCS